MKPIRVASGVLSSWLALATKSARICSARFSAVMSCRRQYRGGAARATARRSARARALQLPLDRHRQDEIDDPRRLAAQAPHRRQPARRGCAAPRRDRWPRRRPRRTRPPRRWRGRSGAASSSRISGSGIAAITASAAASSSRRRMLRSRQPRASRSADCHSASAVPPSRPRRRVAAASEPGSAWGPSASTACCTADSDSKNGAMHSASKIRTAAAAASAAARSRRPVTHSPASTAALGSARPNANTGTRRRPRRFMILMAWPGLTGPATSSSAAVHG